MRHQMNRPGDYIAPSRASRARGDVSLMGPFVFFPNGRSKPGNLFDDLASDS